MMNHPQLYYAGDITHFTEPELVATRSDNVSSNSSSFTEYPATAMSSAAPTSAGTTATTTAVDDNASFWDLSNFDASLLELLTTDNNIAHHKPPQDAIVDNAEYHDRPREQNVAQLPLVSQIECGLDRIAVPNCEISQDGDYMAEIYSEGDRGQFPPTTYSSTTQPPQAHQVAWWTGDSSRDDNLIPSHNIAHHAMTRRQPSAVGGTSMPPPPLGTAQQRQTTTLRGGGKTKPKRRRMSTPLQRTAANVRERKRMFYVNDAFTALKHLVPTFSYEKKKLSRIDTMRLAITYISFMKGLLTRCDSNAYSSSARAPQHQQHVEPAFIQGGMLELSNNRPHGSPY
ncbi:PREDICTED: uncharacterized protein LOC106821427 [Priapulus caudatus]|uniref:Uncharacterized protein LOC106821427 n=1 Tax=Priapulus caudatus TaxID=37621 RepID=A0ABM1FB88_PRICU|nr:PREDICTED: uncharacterized protein LOC106821427 [Priapulus caudatus]